MEKVKSLHSRAYRLNSKKFQKALECLPEIKRDLEEKYQTYTVQTMHLHQDQLERGEAIINNGVPKNSKDYISWGSLEGTHIITKTAIEHISSITYKPISNHQRVKKQTMKCIKQLTHDEILFEEFCDWAETFYLDLVSSRYSGKE